MRTSLVLVSCALAGCGEVIPNSLPDAGSTSSPDASTPSPDGARPDGSLYPGPGSMTFQSTRAAQPFVVPVGVTQLTLETWGAQGGGTRGGLGGYARARITVTPGDALQIFVGARGAEVPGTWQCGEGGGWNGGGGCGCSDLDNTAFGGGGASDVRGGSFGLNDRLVVAGGGGGQGGSEPDGGAGGVGGHVAANGMAGPNVLFVSTSGGLGGGATHAAAGVAGSAGMYEFNGTMYDGAPGNPGVLGVGGTGVGGWYVGSGGGGGGFYGGGSGGTPNANGGGGGSSWAISIATDTVYHAGVRSGDGLVIVSW